MALFCSFILGAFSSPRERTCALQFIDTKQKEPNGSPRYKCRDYLGDFYTCALNTCKVWGQSVQQGFFVTNCTGMSSGRHFNYAWPTNFVITDEFASYLAVYDGHWSDSPSSHKFPMSTDDWLQCPHNPADPLTKRGGVNIRRPTCDPCTKFGTGRTN
ncbi:hypothetical protein O181_086579 [Austropuccinia psidii MF-1]|uniref:Uncharacterized protein n=1 Tax=Austropuccinia psidii MF-1 TaxID=1389203 RepID=A0A9Q3INE9_9BASI|nr:hypothetical protein [Austropuccinia psidii MF-1]